MLQLGTLQDPHRFATLVRAANILSSHQRACQYASYGDIVNSREQLAVMLLRLAVRLSLLSGLHCVVPSCLPCLCAEEYLPFCFPGRMNCCAFNPCPSLTHATHAACQPSLQRPLPTHCWARQARPTGSWRWSTSRASSAQQRAWTSAPQPCWPSWTPSRLRCGRWPSLSAACGWRVRLPF